MPTARDDVVIRIRVELAKAQKKLRQMSKELTKTSGKGSRSYQKFAKQQENVNKISQRLGTTMGLLNNRFQGWALSIMFFGMAMQRAFNMIWRSSTKTFQDVMNSVDDTTNGFTRLDGAIKFLQFTAGAALEPVAMFLIPIIDRLSEWVQQNDELVQGLTVALGVIGTFAAISGMLILAFMGMRGAVVAVKAVMGLLGSALTGLASTIGIGVIPLLLGIAGVALAIWTAWKTNFGKVQDFVSETFGIIVTLVKSLWSDITGIFDGLLIFLEGVFTADWNKIWRGLAIMVINIISAIVKAVVGLGAVIYNVFAFVSNVVLDIFGLIFKFIIAGVEGLFRLLDKIPGVDLGFAIANIDKAKALIEGAEVPFMQSEAIAGAIGGIEDIKQNILVNVELDGQQIAKSVSERQMDEAETMYAQPSE